jgi:hypothetical protein
MTMTETPTSAQTAGSPTMIHIEWWDDRNGADVALLVARTLTDRHLMVPETLHVYNSDCLDYAPEGGGEMDLFLSARSDAHFRTIKDALNSVGLRVKTIGPVPETLVRSDLRSMLDWLYSEED